MKKLSFGDILYVLFLALMVALLLSFAFGMRLCIVSSGSMEPNLPTWSLCLVDSTVDYDEIKVGDIVVYYRDWDNLRIIHRVIEQKENGLVTKGDANVFSDGLSVRADNLYGREIFFIPYLGYVANVFHQPAVLGACLGCFVAYVFFSYLQSKKPKLGD